MDVKSSVCELHQEKLIFCVLDQRPFGRSVFYRTVFTIEKAQEILDFLCEAIESHKRALLLEEKNEQVTMFGALPNKDGHMIEDESLGIQGSAVVAPPYLSTNANLFKCEVPKHTKS
jgi:hypothetical protein